MDLFPEQASVGAEKLDQLYLFLVGVSVFFTGLICILILTFVVRYRRGSSASRSNPSFGNLKLEATWALVPLAIMLVSFGWGANLYIKSFRPPPDALEVFVVGKQWMWKIYHAEGRSEVNVLHVPVGQPIRLKMISEDVIHSFYVPAFRVKQDVLPGRFTTLWFEATKPGSYRLFCAEYCGTSHSLMRGRVVVMAPEKYTRWLAERTTESPQVVGQRLFERHRCDSCHKLRPTEKGPPLNDLFGTTVALENGRQVTRGLEYFRRSLYEPQAQVVAGYKPLMPTYKPGQAPEHASLSEAEMLQLAAYVKSLSESSE